MCFGTTEVNVRDVFDKARRAAPCLFFFDELDEIGKMERKVIKSMFFLFSGNYRGGCAAGDCAFNQILSEIDAIQHQCNNHNLTIMKYYLFI